MHILVLWFSLLPIDHVIFGWKSNQAWLLFDTILLCYLLLWLVSFFLIIANGCGSNFPSSAGQNDTLTGSNKEVLVLVIVYFVHDSMLLPYWVKIFGYSGCRLEREVCCTTCEVPFLERGKFELMGISLSISNAPTFSAFMSSCSFLLFFFSSGALIKHKYVRWLMSSRPTQMIWDLWALIFSEKIIFLLLGKLLG